MSKDQLARIPVLLDVGKKKEQQGELCLEDPRNPTPKKWDQRVPKLCELVKKQLETK